MTDETAPNPVVVGIIDDGIAFAHERFRSGGRTRVHFAWLQDGVHRGPASRVDYGREIWKADNGAIKGIDTMLRECTRAGAVDEEQFYVGAGLFDFRRRGHKAATWRLAHGTHVMDLACGFDPDRQRDDRPIVCVQLPARTTANTSGGDLSPYAADALWYIRDRADEIGRSLGVHPLPVVINFSYGAIGGPHDGTSDLELLMDELIKERMTLHGVPLEIVLPAGNSHLLRCHAQIALARPGEEARLLWRTMPDDRTPSFLDIWMPFRPAGMGRDRVKVTVTPPNGEESPALGEIDNAALEWRPNAQTLCALQYNLFPAPTARGRFRVTLRPTASLVTTRPTAPAGTWIVKVTKIGEQALPPLQAWIQRDESLYGYPLRGRQSYFDDPKYKRYDDSGHEIETDGGGSIVTRARAYNSIGTGRETVVLGGFMRKEDAPARYSAAGPTTAPGGGNLMNRKGPDAMAPSETSKVHGGVLAAGSRSGSVVAMGGTSVAAPQATRWLADQLSLRPTKRPALRNHAAYDDANRPDRPPPERGGAGRVRLPPIVPLKRCEEA